MAANYDSDSDDDAIMMGYLMIRRLRAGQQHQRRVWVHEINADREVEGEYQTLMPKLRRFPDRFFTYFRMLPEQFDELVDILAPLITREKTRFRSPLTVGQQLAICLRFLATGDSFTTIAFNYRHGISTVSKAVYDVCDALWESLQETLLPKPDEQIWKNRAKRFENRWDFPHCMGAIDGKHVIIEAPPNSGSLFFNYKKTFSIVLLAVVDGSYMFSAVDIGAYGSSSDSGIFSNCPIGIGLEQKTLHVPQSEPLEKKPELGKLPYFIVGDEAFPLKDYLLRPYPGRNLPEDKRIFNYRLSRARRISEDAFGLLAQRWRLYQRRIKLHPDNAIKVVKATVILHNFLQKDFKDQYAGLDEDGMPLPPPTKISNPAENVPPQALRDLEIAFRGNRARAHAMQVRDTFKDFFITPEGEIYWQYARVRGQQY